MVHMGVVCIVKVTQGSIGAKESSGMRENSKPESNFSKFKKIQLDMLFAGADSSMTNHHPEHI